MALAAGALDKQHAKAGLPGWTGRVWLACKSMPVQHLSTCPWEHINVCTRVPAHFHSTLNTTYAQITDHLSLQCMAFLPGTFIAYFSSDGRSLLFSCAPAFLCSFLADWWIYPEIMSLISPSSHIFCHKKWHLLLSNQNCSVYGQSTVVLHKWMQLCKMWGSRESHPSSTVLFSLLFYFCKASCVHMC